MSRPDPCQEMEAAAQRVRQPHLDRLWGLGVSKSVVAEMGTRFPSIGVVEAHAGPNGTYIPGSGSLHLVLPIIEGGAIIDLVAFRPSESGSWRTRCDIGWALGSDCLRAENRWDFTAPMELHDTPLNWLRAGGRGICIVDWDSPEVRRLADLERVEVANAALGKVLLDTLSKPIRLPVIEHRRALHVA